MKKSLCKVKMPKRIKTLCDEIDRVEFDPANPGSGIGVYAADGKPLEIPKYLDPIIAAIVQVIQNNRTHRLTKTERDNLRRRLDAYGMQLHSGLGSWSRRRWFLTKSDPLLPEGVSWRLTGIPIPGGGRQHPAVFWRLKDVDEFIRRIETEKPLEAFMLQALKDAAKAGSS